MSDPEQQHLSTEINTSPTQDMTQEMSAVNPDAGSDTGPLKSTDTEPMQINAQAAGLPRSKGFMGTQYDTEPVDKGSSFPGDRKGVQPTQVVDIEQANPTPGGTEPLPMTGDTTQEHVISGDTTEQIAQPESDDNQ